MFTTWLVALVLLVIVLSLAAYTDFLSKRDRRLEEAERAKRRTAGKVDGHGRKAA